MGVCSVQTVDGCPARALECLLDWVALSSLDIRLILNMI